MKVTKGQKYFILVDGVSALDFGSFGIELNEVFPESNCTNNFDDDSDGLVDCADPLSCQGTASCKPGAGAVGVDCIDHAECKAVGNDPLCIDDNSYGWPKGYCSEYCDLVAKDCAAGSLCAEPSMLGGNFQDNGLGVCFKTCTKKADCKAGYMCSDFGAGFVCKL